jgi:hypothetical protein
MKSGDLSAMPLNLTPAYIELIKVGTKEQASSLGGLTKREMFAMTAMQGILSADVHSDRLFAEVAEWSVKQADALLAELEKTK